MNALEWLRRIATTHGVDVVLGCAICNRRARSRSRPTPWGSACTFLAFQVRVKVRRCGKSFAYCAHRHDVATPFDQHVALIYCSGVARTFCLADKVRHTSMHARALTAPARAHVARCVPRQHTHRTASASRRAAFASVVVVARAAPGDAAESAPASSAAAPVFDASQSMNTNPSKMCPVCQGTGWKPCGQCEGAGVNATDLFGGRYRAGDACWLCAGKAKTMCGNCVDLTDTF